MKRAMRRLMRSALNNFSRVNEEIIFICGHQRSGTTAVAKLLAIYGDLSLSDDPRWAWLSRGGLAREIYLGEEDVDSVIERNRHEFGKDVMKSPGATPLMPRLKEHMPRSKFVYIVRDPRDNICAMVERLNKYKSTQVHLDKSMFDKRDPAYQWLENAWLGFSEDDAVVELGTRWKRFVQISQEVDGVLYETYEGFVADKVGFIGRLASSLGVSKRRDILPYVDIQFKKKGKSAKIRGKDRWKDELEPENHDKIVSICGEEMARFGYL